MGEVRQQSKRDLPRKMHERYLKAKGKSDKARLRSRARRETLIASIGSR